MIGRTSMATALTLFCASAFSALAQDSIPAPADPAAYKLHVDRAKAAATGIAANLMKLCPIPPVRAPGAPRAAPNIGDMNDAFGPGRAFDNLYYVGLKGVSAWALRTSAGIILIDALNSSADAEKVIFPGLRKYGMDPATIKYVIVTHGHGDHYGAAQYIADHSHARVIASDADWKLMADRTAAPAMFGPPPTRDMTIVDGQKLTLGDTSITLYITPGHTPGTISLVMPVKDRGKPHMAVLWGGTAFNFTPSAAAFKIYADSAVRFRDIAAKAGADILLSNHSFADDTVAKLPVADARKPGVANPFIIGTKGVRDFLTVASECAFARQAAIGS